MSSTPSTMAGRGQDVRRRLLSAASELIAEEGWTAVSTRKLADRAGVTPGLVHYHFTSLRALLVEAALGAMRGAAAELGPLLDQAESPEDLARLLLGSLGRYTGDDPTSLLFIEAYLAATRDGQLRTGIGEVIGEVAGTLGRWLAERGVPAPEDRAAVLLAAIDGVLLHRALNPGITAESVAAVLVGLITASPTAPPTHPRGRQTGGAG